MAMNVRQRIDIAEKGVDGRPQAPHSPYLHSKSADTSDELKAELHKTEENFIQILMASFKNQGIDPDQMSKASEVAQTQAMIAAAKASLRAAVATVELKEVFEKNALLQNQGFMGQNIQWNDGERNFAGKPITFNYNLHTSEEEMSQNPVVTISIYNSKKKKVFETSMTDVNHGKNSYIWDGRDSNKDLVEHGDYTLEVKAHYIDNKGNKTTIKADTFLSGIVDAIDNSDKNNPMLIVGKHKVSPKSVRILESVSNSKSKKHEQIATDYLHYIGKTAQVKCDSFHVNNNQDPVDIPFIAPENLKGVEIDIYDMQSKRCVHTIHRSGPFQTGYNSIQWDCILNQDLKIKLLGGDYEYKVTGITEGKEEITLANTKEITITSINNGCVFDGVEQYRMDNLVKFTAPQVNADNRTTIAANHMVSEGSQYLGKVITFDDNVFELKEDAVDVMVSIPKPPEGYNLGDGKLIIYDANHKELTTEVFKAATLYHNETAPIPTMDELTPSSKAHVQSSIDNYKTQHGGTAPSDDDIKKFIREEFRGGRIFKVGHDELDVDERDIQKMQNRGLVPFVWQGYDKERNECPPGEYYYSAVYTYTDGANVQTFHINQKTQERVVGFENVAGELRLRSAKGHSISPSRILGVSL